MPRRGYYTRSDDYATHLFKVQQMDKETHVREDHRFLVAAQPAEKRSPRNVLLAEPTPRSRPNTGLHQPETSGVYNALAHGRLASPSGVLQKRVPPMVGGYFDTSYTNAVGDMRRQAEVKLARLEALKRIHEQADSQAALQGAPKDVSKAMLSTDVWIQEQTTGQTSNSQK